MGRACPTRPRYVSTHKRHSSVSLLRATLGRMPAAAFVKLFRASAPDAPVFVTAAVACILARSGSWNWKGSESRVKFMREEPDQRKGNHWQPGYRQTDAACNALRGIGKQLDLWDNLTQTCRIEMRSSVTVRSARRIEAHA